MRARDLAPHLKNLRKSGDGYTARCPFHDDEHNSLSVGDGDDDRLLVHCHAGCENVFEKLIATIPHGNGNGNHKRREVVATYPYPDANGNLIYEVVRFDPKDFRPRRPDGQGGYIWNLTGRPRVLYRLPELLAAGPKRVVFIVEGEKDADRLADLGLIATTNVGGAGKWHSEYNKHFQGRNVCVLPDNDGAGRKHATQVASELYGIASIKVVQLPGLAEKGDVSDWLDAGGTMSKLREIVDAAPVFEEKPKENSAKHTIKIYSADELSALEFSPLRWAIPSLLAEGVFILAGRPKLGKSWLVLNFAVAVASGGYALGTIRVDAGDVLYCALEDGARRLQQRLRKVLGRGDIPQNLFFATEWLKFDRGGLEDLEDWIKAHPGTRLIVFDTLERVRPDEDPKNRLYRNDYHAVQGLQELAKQYNITVLVVHHTRKQESNDHLDLVSGSTGLTGAADGVLILKRARGEADATLTANGRDFPDVELALKFDGELCDWRALGDAGEYRLSNERRGVIALLSKSDPLTPKEVSVLTGKDHNAVKKLLWTMAQDGELKAGPRGKYELVNARNSGNSVTAGLPASANGNRSGNPKNEQNTAVLQGNNADGYPVTEVTGVGNRKPFEPEFNEDWRRDSWEQWEADHPS